MEQQEKQHTSRQVHGWSQVKEQPAAGAASEQQHTSRQVHGGSQVKEQPAAGAASEQLQRQARAWEPRSRWTSRPRGVRSGNSRSKESEEQQKQSKQRKRAFDQIFFWFLFLGFCACSSRYS